MRFVNLTQFKTGKDIWINMDLIESIRSGSEGTRLFYQGIDDTGDGCYVVRETPDQIYEACLATEWK